MVINLSLKYYLVRNKVISENDEYIHKSGKHKNFPSLRYYFKSMKTVFESYLLAKKGLYSSIAWENASLNMLKACENAGADVFYKGMANLKKVIPPSVFISNHMSTLETFLLPAIINPIVTTTYIMKKELVEMPIFGKVVKAINPIVVGRSNPKADLMTVIKESEALLKNGKSIIVFPQKTRSSYLDKKSFNTIGVKIAAKNNVPIVPIAVLTNALNNGKIIKDFGKFDNTKPIIIEIGEPFEPTGNGKIDNAKVIEFIENKFIEWGKKDFVK